MKILLASSEVHPYSKTGGLADMAAALAKYLGRAGHQVGLVTPLYRGIRDRFPEIKPMEWRLELPLGSDRIHAEVWTLKPSKGLTLYFIEQAAFFDRAALYGEHGGEYTDNASRFIFFSKCVAHLARHLPWQPDVVHGHDWQTGLVPLLVLHQKLHNGWWNAPKTCFTIHNLAYQGNYAPSTFDLSNLPWIYYHWNGAEFYGQFSLMKTGIAYADMLTTVSPRYAVEITTPLFGCGLDGALRARQKSLVGILNGVDYEEWRTEDNPCLKYSFSARSLSRKTDEKVSLQDELELPEHAGVPLFATITRLAEQKGITILLGALSEMLAANMQFAVLGNGQPEYEHGFQELARRFPGQMAVRIAFNQELAHRITAGADFYLMPSRYEPCGLNQMYSLRYGTIPIVRATGGLDDTVVDIGANSALASGIKFGEYSVRALSKAIRKALVLYQHPALLQHYRRQAMKADYSWDRTARRYQELYARLVSH